MNGNPVFIFVILHYIALNETISCVNSIKKYCKSYDHQIIVVDNMSPNATGRDLQEVYESDDRVTVILNDVNDGYARGNNVGISYANDKFKPDYIVILNNDIEIISSDFCTKIKEEYDRSGFAVMGTKVISPGGEVGTYPFQPMSKKKLLKQMVANSIKICLLYTRLYQLGRYLKKNVIPSSKKDTVSQKLTRRENVVLHGSCLIFSRKYFEKYDGFDPRTFMYKEEQLLYWRLIKSSLLSVYNPSLVVLHKAEASTKQSTGSLSRKLLFLYKNQLKSSLVLLREIDK